jgi:hypothetical protein
MVFSVGVISESYGVYNGLNNPPYPSSTGLIPFSRFLCKHTKQHPKQGNTPQYKELQKLNYKK